ncbi:outer membrane beta-barrel protein [Dyadobacter sp. CY326]|uniref:outer membrane beta-barrel protein n=1 Tax=Dyadobacter sp. CY326 TaxID=2907300 RepID=UPI001F397878|nr:outer membrane beta-barrel protein [Dyadobacter sp. CY326]MCE7065673.1 porin family protein [Dyadobacter sp. CY326]
MRKLILFSLLSILCLASEVQAQLQKGTGYLGASISFTGQNGKNDYEPDGEHKLSTFAVAPTLRFGRFAKDNVMLGIGLTPNFYFLRSKSEFMNTESKTGVNNFSVTLNPYIRNYKSLSSKWAIFLHSGINLGYLRLKNSYDDNSKYENGYTIGVNLTPGITYWFNPKFSLEADVNVFSFGVNYTNFLNTNAFGISSGISTSLQQYFGVRASWYFQKTN